MIKRNNDGLSSQIFEDLKQKIEEFEYCPGDRISETTLACNYNVSRTPIKHSLSRLENENLIYVRPQIGTFVAKIDTKHVSEFFTIRKLLEVAIIEDVCQEISKDHLEKLQLNLDNQNALIAKMTNDNEIEISKLFWELDNNFHRLIFAAVNKEFVWDFILSQSSQFNRFRFLSTTINQGTLEKKVNDHQDIFNYIIGKSKSNINDLYDEHLFSTLEQTISSLTKKYPDYFM